MLLIEERSKILITLSIYFLFSQTAYCLDEQDLGLIPFPKAVEIWDGRMKIPNPAVATITTHLACDNVTGSMMHELMHMTNIDVDVQTITQPQEQEPWLLFFSAQCLEVLQL